ncbi:MAG: biopolymer transporter ExbD [Opitutales bacterium]|nr:biopolymer transporter ExbD [Opitutales bacterium]
MLLRSRRRRLSSINIVPLIDVMTVLIFFFLMSMKFDDIRQLAITPPGAETATETQAQTRLVVAVTDSGDFYVNSKFVPADALGDSLGKIAREQNVGSLILVADEQTATKWTVFVVDQAQKHGLAVQLLIRDQEEK